MKVISAPVAIAQARDSTGLLIRAKRVQGDTGLELGAMRHSTGNEIAHDSGWIHGHIVRSHDIIRRRLRTVTLIMPPAEPLQGAIGLEKNAGRLLVLLNPIGVRRSTASSDRPIVFASIHRLQP